MPVHHFVHDDRLVDLGLRNYWGYNSIAYLAPYSGYSSRGGHRVVNEFKAMVRALHAARIEVILDVVYNHTAEGNHLGPTLAFRGIDNPSYYRLVDGQPRFYSDSTGTGNSLNVRNPHVLQLMMDSLRYWVLEMHVDGFRFDLAASLARQFHEVDRLSAFFDLIQQDPVISQVKLIAEPWDVGDGGYQVGNFPPLWSEWNGKFRDTVRDYWRQSGAPIGDLAERLTGSSDLYEATGRRPFASINFVTCHDGFTLADLVSYNEQAQRGQRRGRSGRHRRQPVVELRRRRAHRRPRHPGPAPAAGPQLPGHPVPQPGRPDAARRRRARAAPSAATTTPTARTRRCPGTTGPHVDQRPPGLDPAPHRPAPGPSGVPAAPVLPGPSVRAATAAGDQLPDIGWFRPDGARDDRRRLGGRLRQVARRLPQRARHPGPRRPRPPDRRRLVLPALQRVGPGDRLHPPAGSMGLVLGRGAGQRGRGGPGRSTRHDPRRPAGGVIRVPGPRLLVLQSATPPDDQD